MTDHKVKAVEDNQRAEWRAPTSIETATGAIDFEPAVAYVAEADEVWQRMQDLHHRALGEEGPFATDLANDLDPLDALSAFTHTTLAVTSQIALSGAAEQTGMLESIAAFAQEHGSLAGLESPFLNTAWGASENPAALDTAASVLGSVGMPSVLGGGAETTFLFDSHHDRVSMPGAEKLNETLGLGPGGPLDDPADTDGVFGAAQLEGGLTTLFGGDSGGDLSGGEGGLLETDGGESKGSGAKGSGGDKGGGGDKGSGGGDKGSGGGEKGSGGGEKGSGGGEKGSGLGEHVVTGAKYGAGAGAALGGAYGAFVGTVAGAVGGSPGGPPGSVAGAIGGGVGGGAIGGFIGAGVGGAIGAAGGAVVYGIKKWRGDDEKSAEDAAGDYVAGALYLGEETGCPIRPGEEDLFFQTFVPHGPGMDALVGRGEDGAWTLAALPSIDADGVLHTGFLPDAFFDDLAAIPAGINGLDLDPVPLSPDIKLVIDGELESAVDAARQAAVVLNTHVSRERELAAVVDEHKLGTVAGLAEDLEAAAAMGYVDQATIGSLMQAGAPAWMAVAIANAGVGHTGKASDAEVALRSTLNRFTETYDSVLSDVTDNAAVVQASVVEDLQHAQEALFAAVGRVNQPWIEPMPM
ncbi:MAG: hypothetical protein GEU97_19555 [Actinophytocola sp.]|nr:hypothetical protein [Actinophytocola sp.]